MLEAILVLNVVLLILVIWLSWGLKVLFEFVGTVYRELAASEQRVIGHLEKIDERISDLEERLWLQNDDDDDAAAP